MDPHAAVHFLQLSPDCWLLTPVWFKTSRRPWRRFSYSCALKVNPKQALTLLCFFCFVFFLHSNVFISAVLWWNLRSAFLVSKISSGRFLIPKPLTPQEPVQPHLIFFSFVSFLQLNFYAKAKIKELKYDVDIDKNAHLWLHITD